MLESITLACLVSIGIVQGLEIHFIKKAIDMLSDDVWHIEENQKKENENNDN